MAEKRKSDQGIVLLKGERQLSNGRYRYRYTDSDGKQHDVYSWRLRPQDPTPPGKKATPSLREMEKAIQKALNDDLKAWQAGMKLNELIIEYIDRMKAHWSLSTLNTYVYSFQKHIQPTIGKKKVSALTPDNIEQYYKSLLQDAENPLKLKSVSMVDTVLRPALQMAVRKKIISSNPANGVLTIVRRNCSEGRSEPRRALEEYQLEELLEFIKSDDVYSVYYPLFYVLAWTGCRINELLALTWADINFADEEIYIRRSLSYKMQTGGCSFMLRVPKTEKGFRTIPMLAGVKSILLEMRQQSKITTMKMDESEISLEDLSPFIFKNNAGKLYIHSGVDAKLHGIINKYNECHEEKLPQISCHILRHSFCCWLCENVEGENSADDLKYIQSVMGHSNASTTLNIYAELRATNQNSKHEALKARAAGK